MFSSTKSALLAGALVATCFAVGAVYAWFLYNPTTFRDVTSQLVDQSSRTVSESAETGNSPTVKEVVLEEIMPDTDSELPPSTLQATSEDVLIESLPEEEVLTDIEDKYDSDTPSESTEIVHKNTIYTNDFNDDPVGTYTLALLQNDWNAPLWENGISEGHVSVVEAYDGRSLRVLYPEGWNITGRGAQWILNLKDSYDELNVSYRIKFGDGFDFVKGGKIPGFAGGTGNAGGNKPNGLDGWSARMMWRTGGSVVQYVYHPDQPTIYGEDFSWNKNFIPGVWHTVETRIVMNTPGQYDGIIQAWFDGAEALDIQNIRFRDVETFAIDTLRFETFFGGGDASWAPTKDEYVYFDDIVIAEGRIAQ